MIASILAFTQRPPATPERRDPKKQSTVRILKPSLQRPASDNNPECRRQQATQIGGYPHNLDCVRAENLVHVMRPGDTR